MTNSITAQTKKSVKVLKADKVKSNAKKLNSQLSNLTDLSNFLNTCYVDENEKKQGLYRACSKNFVNKEYNSDDLFSFYIEKSLKTGQVQVKQYGLIDNFLIIPERIDLFNSFIEKISIPLLEEINSLESSGIKESFEKAKNSLKILGIKTLIKICIPEQIKIDKALLKDNSELTSEQQTEIIAYKNNLSEIESKQRIISNLKNLLTFNNSEYRLILDSSDAKENSFIKAFIKSSNKAFMINLSEADIDMKAVNNAE